MPPIFVRRYEKPELWLGIANLHGRFCQAPPRPLRGTSPRATFSHSAIDHRCTIRHVSPAENRDGGRLEGASRIGVRDMLSCQSLMPAAAGTPRYETYVVVGGDVWVPCVPPLWIPAFAGMTRPAGLTGATYFRTKV